MPGLREHLRASERLLGRKGKPLVHQLMDEAVKSLGPRHRYLSHNIEFIEQIGNWLGEEAREEAYLHLCLDLGILEPADYPARKRAPAKRVKRP